MAAFSPATHKVVTAPSSNPKDDVPVDARVMLSRLLLDMGLFSIVPGNTAPSNKDELWWHIDVKQVKRWDGVQGNWFPATPNQIAMHIARRMVLGSVTDINLEAGDLFTFWDVSLGEVKKISRESLMAALGAVRTITTNEGIKGGGSLGANRTFSLDIPGLTETHVPVMQDVTVIYSYADEAHRKIDLATLATLLVSATSGYSFFLSGH